MFIAIIYTIDDTINRSPIPIHVLLATLGSFLFNLTLFAEIIDIIEQRKIMNALKIPERKIGIIYRPGDSRGINNVSVPYPEIST